jgi:hypothetical protein
VGIAVSLVLNNSDLNERISIEKKLAIHWNRAVAMRLRAAAVTGKSGARAVKMECHVKLSYAAAELPALGIP